MTDTPPPAPQGKGVRLIDSMPRPLLVVFAFAGIVAVVAALVVIINPPIFSTVPVEERRPPPRGTLSHDTDRIAPVPVPSGVAIPPPPCRVFAGVRLRAGAAGVARLRAVLKDICPLASGGVPSEITAAIDGLDGATIAFAVFQRVGVESTTDFASKTIWLNAKFSRTDLPIEQVVPVVLHEAYHLANRQDPLDARQELAARRAEIAACRQLVPIDKWPRWCKDARALTDLPEARALELLVSAGYRL
jgi:hypothetical protein